MIVGRVERERVAVLFDDYVARGWKVRELAATAGISEKTVTRIRMGTPEISSRTGNELRYDWVTLPVLDRILCGLGEPHLFHLDRDRGGFADVYA